MSNTPLRFSILALALVACDGPMMATDAAVPVDAPFAEGGLLDAGALFPDGGAPRPDGGPSAGDAGAALCAFAECDPRVAADCDEGACVLWSGAEACEDDTGTVGRDELCEDVEECAPGLACFLVDGVGRCGRICCPADGGACGTGATCGGSGMLVDGTATSWGRCLAARPCEVLGADAACEDREACYIVDGAGTTECRVAGEATSGGACEVQEDCAARHWCGGVGVMRRCQKICRIGETSDCESGEACVRQVHTPEGAGICAPDASAFRY